MEHAVEGPVMLRSVIERNNVRMVGQGERTVLLAHGFGCDQTIWRDIVGPLAVQAQARVVLFDYVGCGSSDLDAYDPKRYGCLEGYADDVIEILKALQMSEVVFVGHSVSAMIGAAVAVREPALIGSMVMIAPSPRYIDDPPDYLVGFQRDDMLALLDLMEQNYGGWAAHMEPFVVSNPDQALSGELELRFCAMDPYIARRFAEATFLSDSRSLLPRVQVPSLVLQCLDDAVAPESVGRYVAAALPFGTLSVIDATGHCPHLSHPQTTLAAIRPFLESQRQ
jgi:sigma-B regulation protein RsbQ